MTKNDCGMWDNGFPLDVALAQIDITEEAKAHFVSKHIERCTDEVMSL